MQIGFAVASARNDAWRGINATLPSPLSPPSFKVWRYFRFPMPSSQRFQANLHDTQVLRKRTSKSFKKANSSTWLLKAGTTGVTVDVKVSSFSVLAQHCLKQCNTFI